MEIRDSAHFQEVGGVWSEKWEKGRAGAMR